MTLEPPSTALTASVEDYLKAIYAIERGGGAAATNDVAHRVGVAPGSATGMVRRLADQGPVAYTRYHGVRLTASGRHAALRTLRRHRVLECYLTAALGYPWDRVHDEAERLEHAASDGLIDRMAAALGNPTVDPHGAPIPTPDGAIDETVHTTLADVALGERARVVRVGEHDAGMLRYLEELGLRPGVELAVTGRAPLGGPITFQIGDAVRAIGPSVAARVLVAPSGS
jgi:DtxR family transcriptional regulator, Mn-dependent transcriptional regulator